MEAITEEDLMKAIEPKSDQLNYVDVQFDSITARIVRITRGNSEQPILIYLEGIDRPYKPCKSMLHVMRAAWGKAPIKWVGKWLTLFGLASVTWAGKAAGGIRISHVSGIEKPLTVLLQASRNSRVDWTVEPIASKPASDTKSITGTIDDVKTSGARMGIVIGALTIGTGDAALGQKAAQSQGMEATATYTVKGKVLELVTLEVA